MTTAVVCAAFDAGSDERIERLRLLVEADGQRVRRAHRPHLTLSAARADPFEVASALDPVLRRHGSAELVATGLGTFPSGVLFVAVAPSAPLRALQRDVHATLANRWAPAFGPTTEPDRWVPHCTLATRLPRPVSDRLAATAVDAFPITVDTLTVIEVGGRGDVARLPLAG